MKHYKVYQYTFPDGMIYIGTTSKSLQERRDCGYNHNARLKAAMRSCGWRNIEKTILAECTTQEEAFAEEKRLIAEADSTNPQKGYNISFGGKETYAGLLHTEEFKHKMSERYKGRTFSAETLEKMRRCHKSERKPVVREDGEKYESLTEAAEDVNGHKTNISRACADGRQYKGFTWRFADERG